MANLSGNFLTSRVNALYLQRQAVSPWSNLNAANFPRELRKKYQEMRRTADFPGFIGPYRGKNYTPAPWLSAKSLQQNNPRQ